MNNTNQLQQRKLKRIKPKSQVNANFVITETGSRFDFMSEGIDENTYLIIEQMVRKSQEVAIERQRQQDYSFKLVCWFSVLMMTFMTGLAVAALITPNQTQIKTTQLRIK